MMEHSEVPKKTRTKIQEAIEDYIQIIDTNNAEVPTETIYRQTAPPEENRSEDMVEPVEKYYITTEEVEVARPSEVVDNYKRLGLFEEVAEWMIEKEATPNLDKVIRGPPDENEYTNERIINGIRRVLRDLAGNVMDCAGGFEYNEEDFERIFDELIVPLYSEDIISTFIIPLDNFDSEDGEVSLSPPDYVDQLDQVVEVEEFKISEFTHNERSGIHNEKQTPDEKIFGYDTRMVRTTHKLKIRIRTQQVPVRLIDSLADHVLFSLRLIKPKSDIDLGKKYQKSDRYESYEYEIPSVFDVNIFQTNENKRGISPHIDRNGYKVENLEMIGEFWNQYSENIPAPPIRQDRGAYSRPIERLNQMYEKSRLEDAIIDCAIAMESTLIKDGGKMPQRAVVALEEEDEHSPSFIYDFFRTLWAERNNVVHEDSKIESVQIDGEEYSAHEFIRLSRFFLSKVIIRYIDLEKENEDMNTTQINRDILQPKIAKRLKSD